MMMIVMIMMRSEPRSGLRRRVWLIGHEKVYKDVTPEVVESPGGRLETNKGIFQGARSHIPRE